MSSVNILDLKDKTPLELYLVSLSFVHYTKPVRETQNIDI